MGFGASWCTAPPRPCGWAARAVVRAVPPPTPPPPPTRRGGPYHHTIHPPSRYTWSSVHFKHSYDSACTPTRKGACVASEDDACHAGRRGGGTVSSAAVVRGKGTAGARRRPCASPILAEAAFPLASSRPCSMALFTSVHPGTSPAMHGPRRPPGHTACQPWGGLNRGLPPVLARTQASRNRHARSFHPAPLVLLNDPHASVAVEARVYASLPHLVVYADNDVSLPPLGLCRGGGRRGRGRGQDREAGLLLGRLALGIAEPRPSSPPVARTGPSLPVSEAGGPASGGCKEDAGGLREGVRAAAPRHVGHVGATGWEEGVGVRGRALSSCRHWGVRDEGRIGCRGWAGAAEMRRALGTCGGEQEASSRGKRTPPAPCNQRR